MKTSIIRNRNIILSLIFWLILLEVLSIVTDSFFFPRVSSVLIYSFKNLFNTSYLIAVINSFSKILLGFILALIFSLVFGILSYRFKLIKDILLFPMLVFKTVPVASFIILILLFFGSRYLSTIIGFIMSVSVIYSSVLSSLENVDPNLKEMAKVYQIPLTKQIKCIYFPKVFKLSLDSSSLAMQMCVKAGVAAELIGLPSDSLGTLLYEAKLYLDIYQLFHVTILLVVSSMIITKLYKFLLNKLYEVLV